MCIQKYILVLRKLPFSCLCDNFTIKTCGVLFFFVNRIPSHKFNWTTFTWVQSRIQKRILVLRKLPFSCLCDNFTIKTYGFSLTSLSLTRYFKDTWCSWVTYTWKKKKKKPSYMFNCKYPEVYICVMKITFSLWQFQNKNVRRLFNFFFSLFFF